MPSHDLRGLVTSLANRATPRTEAMVQADVRRLLLEAPLGLDADQVVVLEAQVGNRQRIDVEVGYTVIEVKKDLRVGRILPDAEEQLAGYVRARTTTMGQRYVGVLTDGAEWRAYQLRGDLLAEVSVIRVSPSRPDVDALLVWLEGVLAIQQDIAPTPTQIAQRLGAQSSSHALDRASLATLYAEYGHDPSVQLKRELWAKLLTTALGAQFDDTDELFLEHTLLVNSAKVIAHGLLGLDVATLLPASLLAGQRFDRARIHGVVEPDFFDWVLEVPGGEAFVRTLARRLSRFDWGAVEHDVLKVLYESVIGAETRKRLGEYYTPDWLAERVVEHTVTDPLHQRVLDPACGSGTFLFHAVRRFLTAAHDAGVPLADALVQLSNRVLGVDLHPVAVALARVTYLLAIGRGRLTDPARGPITVPVYLGDSLQWQQRLNLYTADHLVVPTNDGAELFASELRFPDRLLADASRFDRLVTDLADLAAKPRSPGSIPSLAPVFRRLAIPAEEQPTITETFSTLCRLHDEGRDHIWGYYIRNLARPIWLSRSENRVDILLGNPPWLAYRHMPAELQRTFRELAERRGLWHGAEVATQQDLSALFVARTIQQYLRAGGLFAFVLPNAALDRGHFRGFRGGNYPDATEPTIVAFTQPWDLRRLRPHFFPRAACVVLGARTDAANVAPMPAVAQGWTGRLPAGEHTWGSVKEHIERAPIRLRVASEVLAESPYRRRFANGASIFPRLLFFVEEPSAGPLGGVAGSSHVRSARSAYEKPPWKDLQPLDGVVESDFLRDAYLGENVLPFRLLGARRCVLPLEGTRLIGEDRRGLYPGLAAWWEDAERLWTEHSSGRLTLQDRLDYRHGLTNQVPAAAQRVVYSKSGMHLAAARVADPMIVIDHVLYWAAADDENEALYLCSVLNSPTTTELVRPLMSYGKDERHIDMVVWQLPIPQYDPDDQVHRRLAELGGAAEREVGALALDEARHFPALRRTVREALAGSRTGQEIESLVSDLLGA